MKHESKKMKHEHEEEGARKRKKEEKHHMKKHESKHMKHEHEEHSARKRAMEKAMHHKDKLGEGAKKRKHLKHGEDKVKVVMKEFAKHKLFSGSGHKVENPRQALAIGYSEARKRKKM